MGQIIGYVRVSTDRQTNENQKLAIFEYCEKQKLKVETWVTVTASSRRTSTERKIDELLDQVTTGDTIIVAELSRLGRSVGQIAILVSNLVRTGVRVICIKENIRLNGSPDIQTKVMITMFSLFAEIERDLISERTKEGLQRARSQGKLLGRPKGTGKSKLDEHREEILKRLDIGVSKKRIAEDFQTTAGNLSHWLKKRRIQIKTKRDVKSER